MVTWHALLCLGLVSMLGAQQPKREAGLPPKVEQRATPGGSEELRAAEAQQARSRFLAQRQSLPVPNFQVLVEGLALQIPAPPEDARMARAKLRDIQGQAQASLAYLEEELKSLRAEQARQVAAGRQDPERLQAGQGSAVHDRLWALVKDPTLQEGERMLAKAFQEQMELARTQAEHDGQGLINARRALQPAEGEEAYNEQSADRTRNNVRRTTLAWQGGTFLKGFQPAWSSYAGNLDAYLQKATQALAEVEATPQPESTLLLGRTLKLQLFERCRSLIAFSAQVWSLSAAQVLEPRQFADASVSAIPLMRAF